MTRLEKKITNELKNRFEKANDHSINITMKKTGDEIQITRDVIDETPFFELNLNTHGYIPKSASTIFADGWETMAKKIADYDDIRKAIAKNIRDLRKYRKKYIDGHTEKELRDGNDIIIAFMQDGGSDITGSLESDEMKKLYEEKGYNTEDGKKAVQYALDAETYSDWYKSVYDVRPNLF